MRDPRDFSKRPSRHCVQSTCQVVSERDFRLVADRIENLSSWGMLVSPADPIKTGERVYVSFQLPGTTEWFDAQAVVTRVLHGRRPGETTRKLGLEFVDLSPHDRYRLRKTISRVPPVPPGVRPGRRQGSFTLSDWVAA